MSAPPRRPRRPRATPRAAPPPLQTLAGLSQDNFEWAEGYRPRFGLCRIDYETLARQPTGGFRLYEQVIAAHRARAAPPEAAQGKEAREGEATAVRRVAKSKGL